MDKRTPISVKLVFIIFALTIGEPLVVSVIYNQWNNLFADISFGLFLILYVVPLWFIFIRKNWARWFVAILTAFNIVCMTPFVWIHFHQTFSSFGVIWF